MKQNKNKNSQSNILVLLMFFLSSCNVSYHFIVPNHKYLKSIEGYFIIDYGVENYFFPMDVDSTKDYFTDFIEKNPDKAILYSFPESMYDHDAMKPLTKFANKVEIKPRKSDVYTHALIVPAIVKFIEEPYSKQYTKKQSIENYRQTIFLEEHEIKFKAKILRFNEVSIEVAPLLSDSVFTRCINIFENSAQ